MEMAKNKNLNDIAIRNHNTHFTRANLYVELANQTEQGLSNTLFLIATIFLGITSPLVSDVQGLAEGQKTILFMSWMLTAISILSGLVQIAINLDFFAKAFKLSNEQETIWANMPEDDKEFDLAVEKSDKKVDESKLQSTLIPLGIQATTMTFAIVLAIIVGGLTLFGIREPESSNDIKYIFSQQETYTKNSIGNCSSLGRKQYVR